MKYKIIFLIFISFFSGFSQSKKIELDNSYSPKNITETKENTIFKRLDLYSDSNLTVDSGLESDDLGSVFSIIPQIGFSNRSAKIEWRDERIENIDFDSQSDLNIGLVLEARLGKYDDKWAIFGMVDVVPEYSQESQFSVYEGTSQETNDNAIFKYKSLDLSIGVKHYMYIIDQIRFYPSLTLGIRKVSKDSYFESELSARSYFPEDFRIGLGVGLEYLKNLSIEFNYLVNSKNEIRSDFQPHTYLNQTSVKLGYRFELF